MLSQIHKELFDLNIHAKYFDELEYSTYGLFIHEY